MPTSSITITDADIDAAELSWGLTFDAETRAALRCLETSDVQACPGSGKTTALVAKLEIIERQLPLPANAGICVLTHTNVAIGEIKRRIPNAEKLFKAPNYCGTIQSFVDRYLAAPALVHFYGRRPAVIDDDRFTWKMEKEFRNLTPKEQFGLMSMLGANNLKEAGTLLGEIRCASNNGITQYLRRTNGKAVATDPTTGRYILLQKVREAAYTEGILCFDDAYHLANRYLTANPTLKRLFQLRFKYVFLDETQDTAPHQMAILDSIFGDQAVVQRFGDCNQSIYDVGGDSKRWQPRPDSLNLSTSKRLSATIATAVRHVCQNPHSELGGHNRTAIPPKILLFSGENVREVLPAFAEQIIDSGLAGSKGDFRAIGYVSQKKPEGGPHTIPSYFPEFNRVSSLPVYPRTLWGYISGSDTKSPKQFMESVKAALIQFLYHAGDKKKGGRHNKTSMVRRMIIENQYQPLRRRIVTWYSSSRNDRTKLRDEIALYAKQEFAPIFGLNPESLHPDALSFLEDIEQNEISAVGITGGINTYQHPSRAGRPAIEIGVDTVHASKGQTHTATLYLETYYYEEDIWAMLDHIAKTSPLTAKSKRAWGMLPVAYVAMTRPTDLLCVALHKKTSKHTFEEQHRLALEAAGWEVVDVDEVVNERRGGLSSDDALETSAPDQPQAAS